MKKKSYKRCSIDGFQAKNLQRANSPMNTSHLLRFPESVIYELFPQFNDSFLQN